MLQNTIYYMPPRPVTSRSLLFGKEGGEGDEAVSELWHYNISIMSTTSGNPIQQPIIPVNELKENKGQRF